MPSLLKNRFLRARPRAAASYTVESRLTVTSERENPEAPPANDADAPQRISAFVPLSTWIARVQGVEDSQGHS